MPLHIDICMHMIFNMVLAYHGTVVDKSYMSNASSGIYMLLKKMIQLFIVFFPLFFHH